MKELDTPPLAFLGLTEEEEVLELQTFSTALSGPATMGRNEPVLFIQIFL